VPVWSPDGTRIAFASERAGSSDLYIVRLGTGEITRLTHNGERDERQPWWSPTGTAVVYAQYQWFDHPRFYEAARLYVVPVDEVAPASGAGAR
jgi:Tol biopolymer transport system component